MAPPPDVLSNFWAPLCAVGSHGPHGPNAQICVSVFGASIVPDQPRVLVVLSKTNYTHDLVLESGTLAVTLLSTNQLALLEPLGLRSGRDGSKLDGLAYTLTADGDPWFQGAAGWLRCRVLDRSDIGDSMALLCAVLDRETFAPEPMRWAHARSRLDSAFLEAWAAKSAQEQAAAREAMRWLQ